MQTIAVRLGQVIRNRRTAAGLSQKQLAERAGLHWTYVSQLKRGRRTFSVDALAPTGEAPGVSAWELLKEAQAARDGVS